jgi:hypothetical protein
MRPDLRTDGRAGNDLQLDFAAHLIVRHLVSLDYNILVAADNK